MPPTELSLAEARKAEEAAYDNVTDSYSLLGRTKAEMETGHSKQRHADSVAAALVEDEKVYLAARRASDVALVRRVTLKVFQHLRDTGWISFDASDFDPEAVLAEIEKEEG